MSKSSWVYIISNMWHYQCCNRVLALSVRTAWWDEEWDETLKWFDERCVLIIYVEKSWSCTPSTGSSVEEFYQVFCTHRELALSISFCNCNELKLKHAIVLTLHTKPRREGMLFDNWLCSFELFRNQYRCDGFSITLQSAAVEIEKKEWRR